MTFYRVFPDPRLSIDENTEAGAQQLNQLYRLTGEESVRVNMVVSPTGAIVGSDGTSGSLSSPSDRALLKTLRGMADAVLIGAQTLRQERVPAPTGVPLIVLSQSGHVPVDNIITGPSSGEIVVMTSSPNTARDVRGDSYRIFPLDGPSPSAEEIREVTRVEGWGHLLVEGGQRVVSLFAQSQLVDDLCLTLTGAPRSDHTPPVSWWPEGSRWETSHLLMDDERMLYHRYTAVR